VTKMPFRSIVFLLALALIRSTLASSSVPSVHAGLHRYFVSTAFDPAPPPPTSVDLSTYLRIGRFNLPEPTRTAAPPNSLLAQEASGVTYDWDTDTLFVVGDGRSAHRRAPKVGRCI
jgi:uncharacterized protein YjiK